MSYRSMTVCFDNSANFTRLLDFSLSLAARNHAHLTGLHISPASAIVSDPYVVWAPMMVEWEEATKEKQEQARLAFEIEARKADVPTKFFVCRSTEMQEVIAHARASDLVIVGQANFTDKEGDFSSQLPESFVIKVGRPVLFMPAVGEARKSFDTILVAWDGGREAARAIADAMPFLVRAKLVKVVTVLRRSAQTKELPDVDIAAYLARHDVRVDVARDENIHIATEDCLLSQAKECRADLLVMGAYGHNRFTELVFGGVTRSIIREMTLPVLMSH